MSEGSEHQYEITRRGTGQKVRVPCLTAMGGGDTVLFVQGGKRLMHTGEIDSRGNLLFSGSGGGRTALTYRFHPENLQPDKHGGVVDTTHNPHREDMGNPKPSTGRVPYGGKARAV